MRDACRRGHQYTDGSFRWQRDGTRKCKVCEKLRLTLTAPVTPEQELHESVARFLDVMLMRPAEWTCFPAGNVPLPPRFAAKLNRMGLHSGWPDLLFVHANRFFGLELKPQAGRLSETRLVRTRRGSLREVVGQVDRFAALEAQGMQIGIARSVDDVLRQLRAWGLPVRNAQVAA